VRLISSRLTFIAKRVFPAVWFGGLVLWFVAAVAGTGTWKGLPSQLWLIPLFMAAFGYFIMKRLVFDLVDEVWDAGTELVIKNGGSEQHVPLSEIINISYVTLTNPQRVTLSLRQPGLLGKEITFVPPSRFLPYSKSPIEDDLIQRVDVARRQ